MVRKSIVLAVLFTLAIAASSVQANLLLHLDGSVTGSGSSEAFEDQANNNDALPTDTDHGTTGLGNVNGVYQSTVAAIGSKAMEFVANETRTADISASNPDFNRAYNAFSLSMWYKPNVDTDADNNDNFLMGKMGGGGNRGWQLFRKDDEDRIGFLYFDGPDGSNDSITLQSGVTSSDFVHISLSHDGTSLKMYFDGIFADAIGSALSPINGLNNVPLQIGNRGSNATDSADGIIDDVGLWDEALSTERIAAIHAMGKFEDLNLQDQAIDDLLAAFNSQGSTNINGNNWSFATDLTGDVGATGGTSGTDAYVILDTNGNGMMVPEPATMGLLVIGSLGILTRKNKK